MDIQEQIANGVALLGEMETYQEGASVFKGIEAKYIPALIDALDTPNQLVQGGLVEVIAAYGETAIEPVINAMKSDSQIIPDTEDAGIYLQAATRFGNHIFEPLKKRVANNKMGSDSLFALMIATDPTSIKNYESKIIELLGSTDQTLVAVTAEALRHNGEDALPLLTKMIGEINPFKQQNATNVFVSLGAMAVDTLVEATGAISQLAQQNAVRALVEIGEPSIDAVSEALENGTSLQRQNAAIILKQLQAGGKKSSFFSRFSRK